MTDPDPTQTPPPVNWWCHKCGWFDVEARGPVPHKCVKTPPPSEAEMDAMMLKAGWRKTADGKHYAIEAVAPPPDMRIPDPSKDPMRAEQLKPGKPHFRGIVTVDGKCFGVEGRGMPGVNRLPSPPPPPPDAALPGEVEEALDAIDGWSGLDLLPVRTFLRTHIAALTAQNAALVAERDALRGEVRDLVESASPMNVMPSGWVVDYAVTLSAATLARLKAQVEAGA